MDGAKHAERRKVDELLDGHAQLQQGAYKILRSFGIDTEEILFMKTLCGSCGMNHVIEVFTTKLFHQFIL